MLVSHDTVVAAAGESVRIRRALVSVFDKEGLVDLGHRLAAHSIEIVSTGGTAARLEEAGVPVTQVEELTGFPEILDGRVKTLHPAIHGGILFQRQVGDHRAQVEEHAIPAIDLVIVNLYPFAEAQRRAAGLPELIETIDVGGPTMARAGAKNFAHVTVITEPGQYAELTAELDATDGKVSGATRRRLAIAAFARLSDYDRTIAEGLSHAGRGEEAVTTGGSATPAAAAPLTADTVPSGAPASVATTGAGAHAEQIEIEAGRAQMLRYGENPHQQAALYTRTGELEGMRVLQGKELSYNNLLDVDAVILGIRELGANGCVVVKHASPSGIAVSDRLLDAFRGARDGDPLSAFGGIIAVRRELDAETAAEIARDFYEVVVAPSFHPEARAVLAKKKMLRLLEVEQRLLEPGAAATQMRSMVGGYLVQDTDRLLREAATGDAQHSLAIAELDAAQCASERAPSADERCALALAWTAARLVRSNAIVLARPQQTIGIGGGQASRIDAVEVAALKAKRVGHDTAGAALASDGFFPFRDCVDRAHELGVTAIVQPGGSRRDDESVAAANEHGMAMLLTGRRHFLH